MILYSRNFSKTDSTQGLAQLMYFELVEVILAKVR